MELGRLKSRRTVIRGAGFALSLSALTASIGTISRPNGLRGKGGVTNNTLPFHRADRALGPMTGSPRATATGI